LTGFRRALRVYRKCIASGGAAMTWKTPVIIEIAVGLEINAYACAEVD